MEAKVYAELHRLVFSTAHKPRLPGQQFCDSWIAMVYFWAVLKDRCVTWATKPENWPDTLERPLPSQSCMSRRLGGIHLLIQQLQVQISSRFGTPLAKTTDSKPLFVGPYSKDTEAKRGRVANGYFAKGYRMHTIMHGRVPVFIQIAPMNVHDSVIGPELLRRLEGGGYCVADNAYDTNECYEAAAAANHQLVAPPRACNKGVRDIKYNTPQRLRGLDIIDSPLEKCGPPPAFGQALYACRQRIESGFGGLTAMGLGALPSWVRTTKRVSLWAAAKVLLYTCRLALKQGLMT
jgi:hypothetical protein